MRREGFCGDRVRKCRSGKTDREFTACGGTCERLLEIATRENADSREEKYQSGRV
jgi:hypothetical protein